MMMVCKSGPEIDIKETVGQYEFSIVPRSLFATDGTMLHCASKSSLMSILEKLNDNRNNRRVSGPNEHQMKVETLRYPEIGVRVTGSAMFFSFFGDVFDLTRFSGVDTRLPVEDLRVAASPT